MHGKQQCPAVRVNQESMAPTPAHFLKACAAKNRQYSLGRKLRKSAHRSGGNLDLNCYERLTGRLLALLAERINVELQCALRSRDGLSSSAAVHMTARNLWDGSNEASVLLAFDRHDIAKLHGRQCAREHGCRQRHCSRWKTLRCEARVGAGAGTRTRTGLSPGDFKSPASAISPPRQGMRSHRIFRDCGDCKRSDLPQRLRYLRRPAQLAAERTSEISSLSSDRIRV